MVIETTRDICSDTLIRLVAHVTPIQLFSSPPTVDTTTRYGPQITLDLSILVFSPLISYQTGSE